MIGKSGRGDDLEYFRVRAIQEQVAAGNAQCAEARERHDELAAMYRFKVAMMSTGPDTWAESLPNQRQRETARG